MRQGGLGRGALIGTSVLAAIASAALGQPVVRPLPSGVDLGRPLSLTDCARIAVAIHPGLAIAQNAARQAADSLTQTRAGLLPDLSLSGNASAAKLRGPTGGTGGTGGTSNTSTSWGSELLLTQTLFESGLYEQVGSAKAAARASRLGVDDTRRTIVLGVAQTYYAALAARALVDVAGRTLGSSTQHVEAARAKIAEGAAAESDVYPFEVELAQARLGVITAENQMQTSLTALKQAIGLPAEASVQLAEELGRPALDEKLSDLLQTAYQDRPDIRQQRALIESARLNLRVAEIQRGPVLNVAGDASYAVGDTARGSAAQIQAGVSFPVFDGQLTKARADSARAALNSATQVLQEAQIAVGAEVEQSYLNAVQAGNAIDASETALRAAQVSLSAAEERYAAGQGVGTVIDVIDAQVKLRQAEVDRVQAYYDYNTALAALRAAVGRLAVAGIE
jgi:outer membrane protein